jgi:hypothetical protein
MSTSHRAAKAAAVAALTLGATVGVAAAPVHAAPYLSMSSHIEVHPVPGTPFVSDDYSEAAVPDQRTINIDGVVTLSQTAAQDAINHGYTIALRYWGDDPSSDDLLYGPVNPRTVFAAADGLHFQHYVTLPHSLLDEDNGEIEVFADYGVDELYVGARLLDPSGKTVSLVESNRKKYRM